MKTIVHVSDFHFGKIDARLSEPLIRKIEEIKPHLVVVSGDLTQRARVQEFKDAAAFLKWLPRPQLVVPGNHDMPLYDLVGRFLWPFKKYKKYIASDLEPVYLDEEIAIAGINSTRSLSWTFEAGRINQKQIDDVVHFFNTVKPGTLKVLVSHHPFDFAEELGNKKLIGRASKAMEIFSRSNIDMFLAGHFHKSYIGNTSKRYNIEGYEALVVQAGSALSTRQRGEAPAFNVINVDSEVIKIDHRAWDNTQNTFSSVFTKEFKRGQ